MNISTEFLKAHYVGVRELREHLSKRLNDAHPLIVTERGTPTKVIISYRDMIELMDTLDELQDQETLRLVNEGREAIKKGGKGVSVSRLFNRQRSKKKT